MKSQFWVSLKAGQMIYGDLKLFPELCNNHLVVLAHIKNVRQVLFQMVPAPPASWLEMQIWREAGNMAE